MLPFIAAIAVAGPQHVDIALHADALTHPGVVARAAWRLAPSPRGGLDVEVGAGGWWHPGNLVALPVVAGLALRREATRGPITGVFLHGGAMLGLHTAPTWVVEDGKPRRAPLAGRTWALVATGLEVGHRVEDSPIDAWFVRPQLGLRVPTFHKVGVDPALQVGVRFGGDR